LELERAILALVLGNDVRGCGQLDCSQDSVEVVLEKSEGLCHCGPVAKAGHSGYLKNLGRVIRVVRNSGIKNYYPIFFPEKALPEISGTR
jgi:hypothetical protein